MRKRRGKIDIWKIVATMMILCLIMNFAVGCGVDELGRDSGQEAPLNVSNNETTTVMIYMVGSNLESQSGAATMDIVEILQSGVDLDRNNIVLYTGGSSYWEIGFSSDFNTISQLAENQDGLTIEALAGTSTPVNMGEPSTLSEFLNYCYENYKTDKYALICWNHGSGPIDGFGADELFGYDQLSLAEFKEAMEASPFQSGNKLSWVGFDACLMANIEFADMLSEYADYMIASQEIEPGLGWDYSFLAALNETSDGKTIGAKIVDTYVEFYEQYRSETFNPDLTLSCLDLAKVSNVMTAMDGLFYVMEDDLDDGGYSVLAQSRENVKRYGMSSVASKGDSLDVVDLGSVAARVASLHKEESDSLVEALSQFVIYKSGNVSEATGVSVYYPYDNLNFFISTGQNLVNDINTSEGYRSYIDDFSSLWIHNEVLNNTRMSPVSVKNDELILELTQELLETLSVANFSIFADLSDAGGAVTVKEGECMPVIMDCVVEPDDKGVLHVDLNQKVLVAEGQNGEMCIWQVTQTEYNEKETTYCATNARLYQSALSDAEIVNDIYENVMISFSVDNETSEVTIQNISAESENMSHSGKNNVEVEHWNYLGYFGKGYVPSYNEDGTVKPYAEWELTGASYMNSLPIDGGFTFSMKSVSELTEKFTCQITVTDVYGNTYASEIKDMLSNDNIKNYVEQTEQGTITYQVYDDYAAIKSYEGNDKNLEIPTEVLGVPVTKILANAFYGSYYENLVIPEGITDIGDYAFGGCTKKDEYGLSESYTLKSVVLPASLEVVGANPFINNDNLVTISIASGNSKFEAKDNAIYEKDTNTLVFATLNGANEFTIADGTEIIGRYALIGARHLKNIAMPDSLKTIRDYAFCNCALASINLPENLETIGHGAFYYDTIIGGLLDEELQPTVSEVAIPKNVTWIGQNAFSGLPICSFVVEGGNEEYSVKDGFLYNKQGDVLIACGSGMSDKVEIPEGTVKIQRNAFEECDKISELILPDSLKSLCDDVPSSLEKISIGKNLVEWSYSQWAEIEEIQIAEENEYFEVKDGAIVKKEK